MDNIFSIFGRLRREAGVPASTSDGATTTGADWQARITDVAGRKSLLVPAWHRGVALIMQTMGQMLVQYQRLSRGGGNFIEDRYGSGAYLNYLLQVRPNPLMGAATMLEQIEFRKIFSGNAYVYIVRADIGQPAALYLASSGSYDVLSDTYTLTYTRRGGVATVQAASEDVLHLRNVYTSDDYLTGIPTLRYASRALNIAATADDQSLRDMAKGGRHKLLVQEQAPQAGSMGLLSAGRAKQSELKKITEKLGEDWASKDAVFLNNIADAKIISQTAAELKTLETRGYGVADIARILGVPRTMLMDDSSSSYKTPEAATQEFLLRTISPRIRAMEDELNAKLLAPQEFGKRRFHVCDKALRRLDPTAQAALDKAHLETGAMSVNEIRNQYDMPAVADGDQLYLSTNLAALGSEKLSMPAGTDKEGGTE